MTLTDKLVVVSSSLCLAATLLAFAAPAEACSPPPEGWSFWNSQSFDDPVPTDGVLAFELSAYGIGDGTGLLSVEVRDPQGDLVEGSLSRMTLDPEVGGPPGQFGDFLIIWKPTSPLSAQTTYDFSIQAEHPYASFYTIDEQVTFETTSGPAGQLPSATITSASAEIYEKRAGFECCTHENLCDSCGDCEWCWATRYDYVPMVEADLQVPYSSTLSKQVYTEVHSGGERLRIMWDWHSAYATARAKFDEDATGPFCLEIVTMSLIDGAEVNREEQCFGQADLPSFTEREVTDEGPPPECAPDAGSSDAGSSDAGTSDVGSSDVGTVDSGQSDGGSADAASADTGSNESGSDGGGCSSASPTAPLTPSTVAMILALAGLGVSRRRTT